MFYGMDKYKIKERERIRKKEEIAKEV